MLSELQRCISPPEIVFKKSSKYSRRLSKYSRTYDEGTVENSSSYSRPSQKTVEKNAEKIKFVLSLGNILSGFNAAGAEGVCQCFCRSNFIDSRI